MTNADKARPGVQIELDRQRTVLYDLNAYCLMEENAGGKFLSGIDWNQIGARDLRLLLWAGLVHEDPSLTAADVGKMIDMARVPEIMDRVQQALTNSVPQTEKKIPPTTKEPTPTAQT